MFTYNRISFILLIPFLLLWFQILDPSTISDDGNGTTVVSTATWAIAYLFLFLAMQVVAIVRAVFKAKEIGNDAKFSIGFSIFLIVVGIWAFVPVALFEKIEISDSVIDIQHRFLWKHERTTIPLDQINKAEVVQLKEKDGRGREFDAKYLLFFLKPGQIHREKFAGVVGPSIKPIRLRLEQHKIPFEDKR